MESIESSCTVPPGFRFHPTDEELVGYYLKKKVALQKVDLDVIRDIDLYRIEPWDLRARCRIGYEEEKEWYFFSHKDKKYPTGTRTNRATMVGFWKATGRDKTVYDNKIKLIGMRKTLVFYKGRAPNGQKTDWIMHEYRLESDDNGPSSQEEGWVVCKAFKKRINGQSKTIEGWGSSYLYDESSMVVDPMEQFIISRKPHTTCKQETNDQGRDDVDIMQYSDPFGDLTELESPSLDKFIPKTLGSNLFISSDQSNYNVEIKELLDQEGEKHRSSTGCTNNVVMKSKKVTDWRALDKFVASQLSHDQDGGFDQGDQSISCCFGANDNNHCSSDLEILSSMQNDTSRDGEGNQKLDGFLITLNPITMISDCAYSLRNG